LQIPGLNGLNHGKKIKQADIDNHTNTIRTIPPRRRSIPEPANRPVPNFCLQHRGRKGPAVQRARLVGQRTPLLSVAGGNEQTAQSKRKPAHIEHPL